MSSTNENVGLAERLASVRSKHHLSQREFAEKLGFSLRAYQNYERGEREIPAALVRALLEVFKTDPVWLLTGVAPNLGSRETDAELLAAVIEGVDITLQKYGKVLPTAKKAHVIVMLYQLFREREEEADQDLIEDMVCLTAT